MNAVLPARLGQVHGAVREAQGSVFQNIYAEGYPHPATREQSETQILDYEHQLTDYRRYSDRRYYKGVEYANVVEALARRRCAEAFATNMTTQTAWVFGTWLGIMVGGLIADAESLALDYALPAMFIALLVLQIKDRVQVAIAFLSGGLAVGLLLVGVDRWFVILATLIGASIGVGLEKWTKR